MIELRRLDDTIVVTLNAGRANALDFDVLDALNDALEKALEDSPRALVITGVDAVFCAGLALPALIELSRHDLRTTMNLFNRTMRTLLAAPVPTVAAINGAAIAGGCVIALMCDRRIIAGDGPKGAPRIGLNEAQLGIGLPAIVVEPARAKLTPSAFVTVALEGELVEGVTAQALGLVDEVVESSALQARTLQRVAQLTRAGAEAYAQIKAAWLRPVLETMERTHQATQEAWLDTWFSAEAQTRLRGVVAKLKKPADQLGVTIVK